MTRKRILRPLLVALGFVSLSLLLVRIYGVRLVLFPTWSLEKNSPRQLPGR